MTEPAALLLASKVDAETVTLRDLVWVRGKYRKIADIRDVDGCKELTLAEDKSVYRMEPDVWVRALRPAE